MADSGDGAGGWPGLLGQINSTFMLIRDAFGYGLPGAVFLTIGVIAKNRCADCSGFSLQQVKDFVPFAVPAWLGFLALIAACYAAGTVMAATVYMPFSLAKYIIWLLHRRYIRCEATNNTTTDPINVGGIDVAKNKAARVTLTAKQACHQPTGVVITRLVTNTTATVVKVGTTDVQPGATVGVSFEDSLDLPSGVVIQHPREGTWRDWLFSNPTEVTPEVLRLRGTHPEVLNTLDRRETLNVMGGTMAAALLAGYYVFFIGHLSFSQIIWWSGCIMLAQFLTGLSHLRRVLKAIHQVNLPDPPPDPELAKYLAEIMAANAAALKKLAQ